MATKKPGKMDASIAAKLRGMSVVSNTIDYKIEIKDVPDEYLPIFTMKNFTSKENDDISEYIISNTKGKKEGDIASSKKVSDYIEAKIQKKIIGWAKLYDLSTGDEFTFVANEEGACSDEQWELIPKGLKAKLLEFIYTLAGAM